MPAKDSTKLILALIAISGVTALVYFITKKKGSSLPATPTVMPQTPAQGVRQVTTPQPATTEGILKQIAMQELHLGDNELTVRSLRPEDLGLTGSWSFSVATPNAWNNVLSKSLGDNRFLAITGVTYTGTAITQVRIVAGGSTKEIWNIQAIPLMENPRYIDMTPTIIKQNQSISIDVYATASGTESLIFDGIVVEKKGMVTA